MYFFSVYSSCLFIKHRFDGLAFESRVQEKDKEYLPLHSSELRSGKYWMVWTGIQVWMSDSMA